MLPNIQLLRGAAALLVVLVHLRDLWPESWLTNFLRDRGYSGVDLFFVISGFIMVFSTSRKEVGPTEFFSNRLKRIVPLYYSFTLFLFVLACLLPDVFRSTSPDLAKLFKSLAFIPFEKSPGRLYPMYFLGWTLNYEIFFYLLFSVSLYLSYRFKVVVCSTMIAVLTVIPFVAEPSSVAGYFYTRPIMIDFVAGMLLASWRHDIAAAARRFKMLPRIALMLGIGGLILAPSVIPSTPSLYAPATNTFWIFGIPSALIVMSAIGFGNVQTRGVPWRQIQLIGDASYSIYLSHWFVIAVMMVCADRFHVSTSSRVGLGLVALVSTGIVGVCLYRAFERPVAALFAQSRPSLLGSRQPTLASRDIA